MNVRIHPSWKSVLKDEFSKAYFSDLVDFVSTEYKSSTCYPPGKLIFNALDRCAFEKVRVVILGQDPYHGRGQAHGLCFSVPKGIPPPPSLINIFKELEQDVGIAYPKSGNLESWTAQGILLLNATLTVREGAAGSHQNKGWEVFTDAIIEKISDQLDGVVFMLWGGYAKKKGITINTTKHLVLTSGHPSPLSANRGYWFGNRHFSQCNSYLLGQKKSKIQWDLALD